MIPKRLFWLLDMFAAFVAFGLTYAAWPLLHAFFLKLAVKEPSWVPVALRPSVEGLALPAFSALVWMLLILAPALVVFLAILGAHAPLLAQSRAKIIGTAALSAIAATGVLTMVLFASRRLDGSRLLIFSFAVIGTAVVASLRLLLRLYFEGRRDAGYYAKNVVLVGPRPIVELLVAHFRANVSPTEYRVIGFLSGDAEEPIEGVPYIGPIASLGDILIMQPIDEVIAVQSGNGGGSMRGVIEHCDRLGVLLRIVVESLLFGNPRTLRPLYPLQILNLPAVVLAPPHFASDALFFKRILDIIVSATLLIILSPLFLLIATAIKLTDRKAGVFYRWNVVGRNGVRFTGYKFTTMYADADDRRKELLDRNEMTGPVFKIKDDPRITPLGRFLRKYSLNELPQLWSVLKGTMSLVGPRPAFPHELEGYGFWHKRKLSIRPGITCLWQVRGRNRIANFDDWVKMDLEYIDNWSLWLDFKILARTAWAVVAGTGS